MASIKTLGLAARRLGRDLMADNESGNRLGRRYGHPLVSDNDDGNRLIADRNGLCQIGDKSVAPSATAVRLATLPNATIYH
jgi:hypothetical protein